MLVSSAHRLCHDDGSPVRYVPAQCVSQRHNEALALTIHYTAGHTLEGAITTLTKPPVVDLGTGKKRGASAHLVIGRAGEIVQLVPFDLVAWHAGVSSWRGRDRCNDWMIGIELVNRGPVRADGLDEGEYFRDAIGKDWQAYPHAQLAALIDVSRALIEAYPSITEAVGHSDIAPRRKRDPGPAFPMDRYRALLARGEV